VRAQTSAWVPSSPTPTVSNKSRRKALPSTSSVPHQASSLSFLQGLSHPKGQNWFLFIQG
jgi:hypothetical protein